MKKRLKNLLLVWSSKQCCFRYIKYRKTLVKRLWVPTECCTVTDVVVVPMSTIYEDSHE